MKARELICALRKIEGEIDTLIGNYRTVSHTCDPGTIARFKKHNKDLRFRITSLVVGLQKTQFDKESLEGEKGLLHYVVADFETTTKLTLAPDPELYEETRQMLEHLRAEVGPRPKETL